MAATGRSNTHRKENIFILKIHLSAMCDPYCTLSPYSKYGPSAEKVRPTDSGRMTGHRKEPNYFLLADHSGVIRSVQQLTTQLHSQLIGYGTTPESRGGLLERRSPDPTE